MKWKTCNYTLVSGALARVSQPGCLEDRTFHPFVQSYILSQCRPVLQRGQGRQHRRGSTQPWLLTRGSATFICGGKKEHRTAEIAKGMTFEYMYVLDGEGQEVLVKTDRLE